MSFPDYKLAEARLQQRRTKRHYFSMWVALLLTFILLMLAGDSSINALIVPITLILGAFVAMRGYDLYREDHPNVGSQKRIEQEMSWLFGEDWQESADISAYTVAENRIKARQRERWLFLAHLLVFIPFNTVIAFTLSNMIQNGASPLMWFLPLGWLGIIIWQGFYAFPPSAWLIKREQKAGEALREEVERLQPLVLKNGEKLKRDAFYTVGEDGELVELSAEEIASRRLSEA